MTTPQDVSGALATFATGVVVVTVRDDRDDIGTTVSAFASVSLDPPTVLVSVATESYLAEVLSRQDRWAATVLAVDQRAIAGRFAAAGRPNARILLAGVDHHRGPRSDALIVDGGLAGLECHTQQRIKIADHILAIATIVNVDYLHTERKPLVRVNRTYG